MTATFELSKPEAAVQAYAALGGVRVDPIDDDAGHRVYIVSRWHLTRECGSLDEVRSLLKLMGIRTE